MSREYGSGDGSGYYQKSRSRSRSRSRERDRNGSSRRSDAEDTWNKNAAAFISSLGASQQPPGQIAYPGGYPHQVPTGYPNHPTHAVGYPYGTPPVTGYPPPHVMQNVYPMSRTEKEMNLAAEQSGSQKRRSKRDKDSESGSSEEERNSRKYGNDSSTKKSGITYEQKQKFKDQLDLYVEAKVKLELHLLNLKQKREDLKMGGAKHEDLDMKENARSQKEVKAKIVQLSEVMSKLELALNQPLRSKSRSPLLSKRKMDNRSRSQSKDPRKSSEKKSTKRDSSGDEDIREEKEKKKKKKKKRERSSSEEDSDRERSRRKKKKKRKSKKAGSSSDNESSSDSENDSKQHKKKDKGVIQMDETMFRMLADAKTGKAKKSDETLMDMLAKMSDAYVKTKAELAEKNKKVLDLEAENLVLKKQVTEFQKEKKLKSRKVEKGDEIMQKAQLLLENSGDVAALMSNKKKKDELSDEISKKRSQDSMETSPQHEERRDIKRIKTPDLDREESSNRSYGESRYDNRQDRYEDRYKYRSDERYDRYDHYKGRGRYEDRKYDTKRDYRDERRDYRDERKSRRDDSPPKRRDDSPKKSKEDSPAKGSDLPPRKDKYDRVNLEDWVQKPGRNDPPVDSDVAQGLKQKMKQREEKEKQKEEYRKRWNDKKEEEDKESDKSNQVLPEEVPKHHIDMSRAPLPSGPRPQVNMQWGQSLKKPSENNAQAARKAAPVIGKMPGLNRSKKTPDPERALSENRESPAVTKSRFGQKASNVPPPTTAQPNMYGLTSEMYMQAIAATMPTEPPPPEVPVISLPVSKPPPKNPTPSNVDIGSILAAAKAHIKEKKKEWNVKGGKMEDVEEDDTNIPLPPLPAAQDKDPEALLDTRPPKIPTPKHVLEKSEMELMIEKHNPSDENEKPKRGFGDEGIDPTELEMLGIDPSDFAGFGN